MKQFFYLMLVALMWGCSSQCLDGESQVVVRLDGVVNVSGTDVKMTFVGEDTVVAEVKNGDTLQYIDTMETRANVSAYECGLYIDGCNSKPQDVKVTFLTDPQKCIYFEGKVDLERPDIRLAKSYRQVGEYMVVGAQIKVFRYFITSDLLKQAVLCK